MKAASSTEQRTHRGALTVGHAAQARVWRRLAVRAVPLLVGSALLAAPGVAGGDPWPALTIPAENRAALRRAPPRPPPGDVDARAQHLANALGDGNADPALDFFFPLEPFLAVKDMSGAARYHATLVRAYRHDIETYRAQLPRGEPVQFARFQLSQSCTWMTIGREANRLPYWSCYGSRLVVRAGAREVTFRVQVVINWGDRWYITHLGPIPRPRP